MNVLIQLERVLLLIRLVSYRILHMPTHAPPRAHARRGIRMRVEVLSLTYWSTWHTGPLALSLPLHSRPPRVWTCTSRTNTSLYGSNLPLRVATFDPPALIDPPALPVYIRVWACVRVRACQPSRGGFAPIGSRNLVRPRAKTWLAPAKRVTRARGCGRGQDPARLEVRATGERAKRMEKARDALSRADSPASTCRFASQMRLHNKAPFTPPPGASPGKRTLRLMISIAGVEVAIPINVC